MSRKKDQSGLVAAVAAGLTEIIGGVLGGGCLLAIGFFILVWGEARVNIGTSVVEAPMLGDAPVVPGGPVVHTGAVDFIKRAPEPILAGEYAAVHRTVETCAWHEKEPQGSSKAATTYIKSWTERVPDSEGFSSRGYDNPPGNALLKSRETLAGGLKIGDVLLGEVTTVFAAETIAPRRADVKGAQLVDKQWAYMDGHAHCREGGEAQIGDQRVSFRVVRRGDLATAFGRWEDRVIEAYRGQVLLARGPRDKLLAESQSERELKTWIYRSAGALVLWIALYLLLKPALVLVRWIPLVGGLAQGAATVLTMLAALALTFCFVFLGWGMAAATHLFGGFVG